MMYNFPIYSQHLFSTNPGIQPMVWLGPINGNGFAQAFAQNVPPDRFADHVCGERDRNIKRAKRQLEAAPCGRRVVFDGGGLFARAKNADGSNKFDDATHAEYMRATDEILRRHKAAGVIPDLIIGDVESDIDDTAARLRAGLYDSGLFDPAVTRYVGWQMYDGKGPQKNEYTKPGDPATNIRKRLLPSRMSVVHAYLVHPMDPDWGRGVSVAEQVDQIIGQARGAYDMQLPWAPLVGGYLRFHGSRWAAEGDGGFTDDEYKAEYTRMARSLRDMPGFAGVWWFPTAGVGFPGLTDPSLPAGTYPEGVYAGDLDLQMREEGEMVRVWKTSEGGGDGDDADAGVNP